MHAFKFFAICSIETCSRPKGTLCTRRYVDSLLPFKALYLAYVGSTAAAHGSTTAAYGNTAEAVESTAVVY